MKLLNCLKIFKIFLLQNLLKLLKILYCFFSNTFKNSFLFKYFYKIVNLFLINVFNVLVE